MRNKIIYLIISIMSLWGCSDYLDLVPENDIKSIESVFERRTSALNLLLTCYQGLFQSSMNTYGDPAVTGADEYMTNSFSRTTSYSNSTTYLRPFLIAEGRQSANSPICDIWSKNIKTSEGDFSSRYTSIRNCNTFIDNIDKVYDMDNDEKAQYKAEAYALKAYYYFELVRQYGPIVLVPENIGVGASIPEMQLPRSHVDTCFNTIVKLFDKAIPDLRPIKSLPKKEKASFSKEAAVAFKAKALLYAASPLFNGNDWYASFTNRDGEPLFSSVYDNSKWERAAIAIDDAIETCEKSGLGLYSGNTGENTEFLNTIKDIQKSVMPVLFESNELVFGVLSMTKNSHKLKIPRYNKEKYKHSYFCEDVSGNLNPTMRMVELFYTENGLPINQDKTYPYGYRYSMGEEERNKYIDVVKLNEPVLNLHLKREPRFYANIAADKCLWQRGTRRVEMNPYKDGDHGTILDNIDIKTPQNLTGYWVKKFVPVDFYAPSNISTEIDFPAPVMRMADLYLMQAEAWNEFEGPSAKVYDAINKVRTRAGLPGVVEAWSSYALNPEKVANKTGLRDIIRQEIMIEFAFEGHRFWDMRRWKIAHENMNRSLKGWNVFGEDSKTFYNSFEGPIEVWKNNSFEFPRDYFWPISTEEISISNIKQNLGW